jgi:hypothetical protein
VDRVSLLASGCAALIVTFVLQTPDQILSGFSLSTYYRILGIQAGSIVSIENSRPKRQPHIVVETVASEEPDSVETLPDVPEPMEAVTPEPVQRKPAPPVSVVKEEVHLYALNHAESAVVVTLPKGEIVEPQMQVNDSGLEWSYVTAPALRVSGYLQSDCLELR